MPNRARIEDMVPFLLELNRLSAEVILPLFRAEVGVEDKGGARGYDPVTAADKGAEAAIRQAIAARYPDHGVVGEEYGADRPTADYVWVLDPIDGTRAFVAGLPLWTTLIGLRFEGRPVLGSIGQPFIGETYLGHAGGSHLHTAGGVTPLRVRPCPGLGGATIATTDADLYFGEEERAAWKELRARTRIARQGCDAYAYAMVARGTVDLVVEAGLQAWDVDAAIPVLEGAGGFVRSWAGGAVGRNGGQVVFAGDQACLDEALALLTPAAVP